MTDHDIGMEREVLASMMLQPDCVPSLIEDLSRSDFYVAHHADVFSAIKKNLEAGDPTSLVAVAHRLGESGDLERIGGASVLHDMCQFVPVPVPPPGYYVRVLKEYSSRREAVERLARAQRRIEAGGPDAVAAAHAELGDFGELRASGGGSSPRRFARTILRRSELRELPPVEPLIEGIMSLRSTVMLIGSSGAGKTFLSIAWACAIGTGTSWLGRPVQRAKVLYVVGEGANGLDDRITAWEKAWGVKVTDDDVMFSVRPESLASGATWAEMEAEATHLERRVVFLDTYSSLASDTDETRDAAMIVRHMSDLAAVMDGSVILIHHPGWADATRARGGSQLESNADEVLVLHGTKTEPVISLERKKVKEGISGDKIWLKRKPSNGSVIIEAVAAQERTESLAASAEQVAALVFGTDAFTRSELREALIERMSISKSTAYQHITAMRDSLRHVSGKGRSSTYRVEFKE